MFRSFQSCISEKLPFSSFSPPTGWAANMWWSFLNLWQVRRRPSVPQDMPWVSPAYLDSISGTLSPCMLLSQQFISLQCLKTCREYLSTDLMLIAVFGSGTACPCKWLCRILYNGIFSLSGISLKATCLSSPVQDSWRPRPSLCLSVHLREHHLQLLHTQRLGQRATLVRYIPYFSKTTNQTKRHL